MTRPLTLAAPFAAPLAALAVTLMAGAGHAAIRTQLPAGVEPTAYDLTVTPDAKALTFKGAVKITVTVAAPTRTVTLNAVDLAIGRATLDGATLTTALDPAAQTATFTAAAPIAAGRHVLAIDYTGKIVGRPSGLFHVDYDAKARGDGRMLATQFEPADARRFLPSFDEPAKKATFTVTAVAPADQTVIANMPPALTEPLPGGMKRVRFATTPKMSTYLLFFGMGDMERITAEVDGTEVGVLIKRGDTEKARFALDAATRLLHYYNGYFGVKYPLPKLDLIAAPGEAAGAMENWGAILYTQSYIVIDPKAANERERQTVFGVIAHEMAHQWFGDLVTMAWWDDLWLNEGFASWMSTKASDHFHPEWKPLLQALIDKDGAMRPDAKASTHPIVQPVETVAQAEQAFDAITYQKGEAVIRMLEAYAGEDAWMNGVRRYMAAHAYGNTQSADLWREIDAAAGKPVSQVATDFTTQPGVPLLSIDGEPPRLRVAQGRFGVDAGSKAPLTWKVPVGERGAEMLVSGAAPQPLPPGTLVANAGQTAYARTLYAPAAFGALKARFATLPAADQIASLNDTFALGLAGYAPMAEPLDLLAALPPAADPVTWRDAAQRLRGLSAIYTAGPSRTRYRAWAAGRLQPVLAQLGWEPKPGEGSNDGVLREALITTLADLDDTATLAEARRRFATPESLPPGLRTPVLNAVAAHADAATFDRILAAARATSDPLEKSKLYQALGLVRDPALAQRVLDLAVSPEIPGFAGLRLIGEVAGEHPDLVWRFVLAHTAEIAKGSDSLIRGQLVPGVASNSRDARRADELEAYAKANIPPDAQAPVRQAVAQIRYNADISTKRTPEIDAWIAAHR